MDKLTNIGIVIIGRNEGERLRSSIMSVIADCPTVVYVDSASTDDSRSIAKSLGVSVIELDMTLPFTAARARNTGFELLNKSHPELEYIQFIDGDCDVEKGWLEAAVDTLDNNPDVGVVCGRRKERYPENSIYNELCDIEWDTPIGDSMSCGGDFLIRSTIFREVKGFNELLIAGEEPELCIRIRQNNWKINRIDKEMTLHDANILHFSQWWKRNIRSGHSYAEGATMYGSSFEFYCVSDCIKIWIWAGILPISILVLSTSSLYFLLLFLIYPIQVFRIAKKEKDVVHKNWLYAFFVVAGKFPELQGQIKFLANKIMNSKSKVIEYK